MRGKIKFHLGRILKMDSMDKLIKINIMRISIKIHLFVEIKEIPSAQNNH